jgi:hypothetical protein
MTAHDNGRATSGAEAGLNVAIVQMNTQDDKHANIAAALDLIDRAAATVVMMLCLSFLFSFFG